ncbi:RluA family pseudouridine synthase [Candidatus Kaiserbacteria bacterium CG10_big_fil_rev_8_21_14_0_10_45_20]|uniref:RluA family pseudouridine synthase n=1 Tax=Candidatus Kaiserbacteria bacterium CG10_big_fil_rev_8_21_14_0_10_45_20 TaxID=1974607 RepID=A0A2H0UF49_9BACT|nr:MAG: RluA family pseudouridine synthase [Candidatus Kaiserbacteria bacterium CG10_big_fil_rev_8_21_14_0_10_45_20]
MDIPILYENDDIVVVNKPSGISMHQDGRKEAVPEETVSDWFIEKFPMARDVGESITLSDGTELKKPGVVHRLDKMTSGVVVLVKNQDTYQALKEQFQSRGIKKTYRAFVWGEVKKERGIITFPVGRSRSDFRKRSAEPHAKPPLREARTDYRVICKKSGVSYVEAMPHTGRTHQIRVHFKALNHPIIGDTLYAPKRKGALGFTRLALHAHSLSFTLPTGEKQTFVAPLPQDFMDAEQQLQNIAE